MKKIVLLLAMAGFLFFTTNAFALPDCPPGQEKKGWKCVDIEETDDNGNIIGNFDNDIDNTILNMNLVNLDNQINADFRNRNDVDVRNSNLNSNKNSNLNLNDNSNRNKVSTSTTTSTTQSQEANNEGNTQTLIYNDAKDPVNPNHITPDVNKTDADAKEQYDSVSKIRTFSSIFKYDTDSFITMEEADKASNGGDVKIDKAILWTPKLDGKELELDTINWKDVPTGKYMGSITLTTETATADQVLARACKEAMLAGATGVNINTSDAKIISGTKYGLDFGSAASVALNPNTGSAVIAPGASLGWSKAKSDNRLVSEVYIEMFFDSKLIIY